MTKEHIESIRSYFRRNRNAANIFSAAHADEMLELCDMAEKSLGVRLALLGIDRMLESVRDELKNIESGNHATIACLMSEGKGLTAAKMLLEGALRGHHGDHVSGPQLHDGKPE